MINLQLEIVVDKGEIIRYSNVRNMTYKYVIPNDAKDVKNVTNNVSVSIFLE